MTNQFSQKWNYFIVTSYWICLTANSTTEVWFFTNFQWICSANSICTLKTTHWHRTEQAIVLVNTKCIAMFCIYKKRFQKWKQNSNGKENWALTQFKFSEENQTIQPNKNTKFLFVEENKGKKWNLFKSAEPLYRLSLNGTSKGQANKSAGWMPWH